MQGEMAEHLDRSIERLMARGLSREAARAQALREFGNVAFLQEEARDAHGVRWLHEFAEDMRYSARALAHAPAYTIFATLILALGIGATTAIFSAVDAVLLARLPYRTTSSSFASTNRTRRRTRGACRSSITERLNSTPAPSRQWDRCGWSPPSSPPAQTPSDCRPAMSPLGFSMRSKLQSQRVVA